ncbi:MAG: hypothetical protein Q7S92_05545 [Candidatus Diapherotrites archaeon]|nr:hypothetical protein [Candidatus Diapherotrites archaeon]
MGAQDIEAVKERQAEIIEHFFNLFKVPVPEYKLVSNQAFMSVRRNAQEWLGPIHPIRKGKVYIASHKYEHTFFADIGHLVYEAYVHGEKKAGKKVDFDPVKSEIFDQLAQYLGMAKYYPKELTAFRERMIQTPRQDKEGQLAKEFALFIIQHSKNPEQMISVARGLLRPKMSVGRMRQMVTRRVAQRKTEKRKALRKTFDKRTRRLRLK